MYVVRLYIVNTVKTSPQVHCPLQLYKLKRKKRHTSLVMQKIAIHIHIVHMYIRTHLRMSLFS